MTATLIYTLLLGILLCVKTYLLPYLKLLTENKFELREYDLNLPKEKNLEPEEFDLAQRAK